MHRFTIVSRVACSSLMGYLVHRYIVSISVRQRSATDGRPTSGIRDAGSAGCGGRWHTPSSTGLDNWLNRNFIPLGKKLLACGIILYHQVGLIDLGDALIVAEIEELFSVLAGSQREEIF